MKVFARKQSLSILASTPARRVEKASFEMNSTVLRDSFHGWLDKVGTFNLQGTKPSGCSPFRAPRLTVLDIMRVNHATIREGETHCIWPTFALQTFHQADVITDKKTEHYRVTDANLRRVN